MIRRAILNMSWMVAGFHPLRRWRVPACTYSRHIRLDMCVHLMDKLGRIFDILAAYMRDYISEDQRAYTYTYSIMSPDNTDRLL
jgi:hypothetical protein